MDDTPETNALLDRGKLDQTCPACGLQEAAGHYCTACERRTGPPTWYRKGEASRVRALAVGFGARNRSAQQALPDPEVVLGATPGSNGRPDSSIGRSGDA